VGAVESEQTRKNHLEGWLGRLKSEKVTKQVSFSYGGP
jgi:hypothetical protein